MNKRLRHIASVISPYDLGEKTFLSALTLLKRKKRSAPIPALFTLIQRLAPGLKVVSQVRAGRTIYLPAYLKDKSATYHALRWSLAKEGFMPKTLMAMRLITNLLEASAKTGVAYKSKRELNISVVQSRVNYRRKRRKWTPLEIRKHQKQKRIPYLIRKQKAISLKNRPAIRQLTYLTDVLPPALMTKMARRHKRKFKKRRPLKEKHIKLTQEKQKMHSRNMTKLSKLQNNILLVILYIIIVFSITTSFDHWCDISKQYAGKTFTTLPPGAKKPISVTCFDEPQLTIARVISLSSFVGLDDYYNGTNTSRAILKYTTVIDEKYTFLVYHYTIKFNFKADYITQEPNETYKEFRAHLYFPEGVDLIKTQLIQQANALQQKINQVCDVVGSEKKKNTVNSSI